MSWNPFAQKIRHLVTIVIQRFLGGDMRMAESYVATSLIAVPHGMRSHIDSMKIFSMDTLDAAPHVGEEEVTMSKASGSSRQWMSFWTT